MQQVEWEEQQEELNTLRGIANLARVTREAQMMWFSSHNKGYLRESIRLEKKLDDDLSKYFGGIPLTEQQALAIMRTSD